MKSAIYQGTVQHRRRAPAEHRFTYRMFMMYLDLSELPHVFSGSRWFSATRRAAARFCREDHLGDAGKPLDESVRDLVEQHGGRRPDGPIRLLTHLRYFGYVFNPVSFYYCFNADDTRVETIVAEVTNTPWGERHCYVLTQDQEVGHDRIKRYQPVKRMHVSPFMPMDIEYDWRFAPPGEVLSVHMENSRKGIKLFDATLVLRRREITARSLASVLLGFPLMTVKVIAAIHWQALRLWLKGCKVYEHPMHAKLKHEGECLTAGDALTLEEKT
jgi:DUF1365 family protein